MKRCARCGVVQPRTNFPVRIGTWLSSYCRPCKNDYDRERRLKNLTRERVREQARNAENAERWRRWKQRDPDRQRRIHNAGAWVYRAVRDGRLVRPAACEECKGVKPVEGAHRDYDRPLEVRWLCRSCHIRWDHAVPKAV